MQDIEIIIIEKWLNIMLRTIRYENLGPTYTARFLYLVSTIIYYTFACFNKAKNNCIVEKELQMIYLEEKDTNFAECIIFYSMEYLYDLLGYNKKYFQTTERAITNRTTMVIENIKRFLDRRNNDGWKKADIQQPYPNGNVFIDVENAQNLPALLIEPKKWTPLKHKNGIIQKYLTPDWGKVTPLETLDITKYAKISEENLPNANMDLKIEEVLKEYENLNDTKRMIAEYFQGGQVTPPGIWNVWGLYAIKAKEMPVLEVAKFFYLLNSTLFMASIAAWDVKKTLFQARPIQAIRLLRPVRKVVNFDGTLIDNTMWKTFQQQDLQSPNFSSSISGHSTFSSSAAVIFDKFFPGNLSSYEFKPFTAEHCEMITALLKDNYYPNTVKTIMVKTGSSAVAHDTTTRRFPLSSCKIEFNNWRHLAELSGISRIYGGIHYQEDNHTGLIIGEEIGRDILNRAGML
jgi:hypothetical protein